jgi:Family of unknown function (DUF6152)
MKLKLVVSIFAGGLSMVSAPLLAHHSFMAEFDEKQPVNVEGVVTDVKWQNPHTFFTVEAKDGKGKKASWILETGSPNALILRGWTRETMKLGDHVSVRGYRAKAGSNLVAARSVTLADGRTIFGGQTDDGGPTQ